MKQIQLHPDACAAFDKKIAEIRTLVQSRQPPKSRQQKTDPDLHIAFTLGEDDLVGNPVLGSVDALGNPLERWVRKGSNLIGFGGDAFQTFRDFCRQIQNQKAFRDCVSEEFIEDTTFDWLTNQTLSDQPYSSLIQARATESIIEAEYWIPIAHLRIGAPIRLGNVVFRRNTKQMFDALENSIEPKTDEEKQAIEAFILRQRKKLQAYTSGTITITAETQRGRELAFDEVDIALSVLRFFDPGSLDPAKTAHIVPQGQNSPGSQMSFVLKNCVPTNWVEGLIKMGSMDSLFPADFIAELQPEGLDAMSTILQKQHRTDYEKKLLESLLIYSRVSISPRLSDKLVYMLVALESIFLKNQTEPIKKNLGERIAFLIGTDLSHRKHIVALIDEIYGIRSTLIHHGKDVTNEAKVRNFMHIAWSALHALIVRADHFTSKESLLIALDDRKLS